MFNNFKDRLNKKILEKRSIIQLKKASLIDRFLLNEKPTFKSKTKSKKINYYVCFWGEKYHSMVLNILIPSLNQPNNAKKLNELGYEQTLYIYCPYSKEDLISSNHVKSLSKSVDVQVINFKKNVSKRYEKFILRNNLIDFIEKSLRDDAISSVLTADMIIGDESLLNMVKLIDNNDNCLASIHPRVKYKNFYDFFSNFFNNDQNILTNKFLVKKSLENLHKSWDCFLKNEDVVPIGNHIKQINEHIYQARSSRVNVAFSRYDKTDLKFFQSVDNFNWIDRLWPRKLILENRYRFVSDSDLYFFSELTKEDLLPVMHDKSWLQSNLSGGNLRTLNFSVNDTFNAYWRV